MQNNKITSPKSNLSIEIYNPNGTERVVVKNDTLYLSNAFTPDYHHKIEKIVQKELKCVYVDPNPKCESCESEKLSKKYLNLRKLNKNHSVYVTAYICDKCSAIHRTSLELFIDKHDTYTKDVKGLVIKVNFLEHMSLNNISLLNLAVNDANPCRQTILNGFKKFFTMMKFKNRRNRKLSGNYGYDEQYIKINGKKFYILALFDIELNVLVDYKILGDLKKDTMKNFIKEATEGHKKIAITTDGRKMYKNIVESLRFIHNLCIFHLIKDLNDIIYKKTKSKKLDPNVKAQYLDEGDVILLILYQKDYKKAKKKFQKLLNHMDKIPMELRNFINTKLKPNFDSYMRHTIYDFLPTTNNALENYFGVILPRHLKKIYKTIDGITMYLDLQMEKWDENHGNV